MPPFDNVIEVTLTPNGNYTSRVIEVRGLPLEAIAAHGAGWQIQAESLATYLASREPGDPEARWAELVPRYEDLAASLS